MNPLPSSVATIPRQREGKSALEIVFSASFATDSTIAAPSQNCELESENTESYSEQNGKPSEIPRRVISQM